MGPARVDRRGRNPPLAYRDRMLFGSPRGGHERKRSARDRAKGLPGLQI